MERRQKVKKKRKQKNCTFPNCPKDTQGATDFCFAHGGGKRCQGFTEVGKACPNGASGATDFCKSHGGGKRCQGFTEVGKACPKSAQGATDFCKAHGGGKRCQGFTEVGKACPKSALGATDFCSVHGGGKRCTFLDCPKSARGATDFCSAHGGGKRCTFLNCPKSAQGATDFCSVHGGGKRCTFLDCPKSAIGATDFCSVHGGGKRCSNCINWIDSQGANKKFNGFCARCYCRLFPNDPRVRRNNKTKEGAVLCHIRQCFPDLIIPNDRRIDGGCSKKKPDFFIELLTHVIIIEVDENAHMTYDQSCENKRIMQLSEDIAHRPMVLIRFNPDKNSDGPSCWGVDGHGLVVVKKKQAAEWQKRLVALTAAISFWKNTIPDKIIELIKLFY